MWPRNFIRLEPKNYLEKTTCPVLALKDIKNSLEKSDNKDLIIKGLEGLNHLSQTAKTLILEEYSKIEETFSPIALETIKGWILERFN